MIRWLSISDSFLEQLESTASSENLQGKEFQAIGRCASRQLQFGQQFTPRAPDDGKQCRVLE